MNDPNSFGYQEMRPASGEAAPGARPEPNLAQYKFSSEEMHVLAECNRESFFRRSLPLGVALGLGTAAAVQFGHLKANPRFGAVPKVTLAVVAGYFLGKLSYQQACADKLMALPGSYVGQLLRDRRDGRLSSGGGQGAAGGGASDMLGARPGDVYSDAGPGRALLMDEDRAGRVFSEDLSRPDHAGAAEVGGAPPAPAPPSYEELRRRNRGQHAAAQHDPYRVDAASAPAVRRPPAAPRAAAPHTNAYGDVVE